MNISKNTPKKTKKETKTGFIIIGILVALVALAIIFAASNAVGGQSPTQLVNIPAVETMLVSADGSAHMFGARIVLELDSTAGDVDQGLLYAEISAAIAGLSYEDVISFQGPDIIRSAVQERVSGNLTEDALVAVFLTEIASDIPMLNRDVDRPPGRNLMFDAVFGGRD